jgi:hypothetical protein
MNGQSISILIFADSILGIKTLCDWQCKILLNYEAGRQTAAACANFTGKTSTVFPIAALWTLYNFPRASRDVRKRNWRSGPSSIFLELGTLPFPPSFQRLGISREHAQNTARRFPLAAAQEGQATLKVSTINPVPQPLSSAMKQKASVMKLSIRSIDGKWTKKSYKNTP